MQTVVETAEFIKQSAICMDEISRRSFVNFIARKPLAGDLIPGTGGARKVRWTSDANQGKRGGARVIYYYHNQEMPIFLFTAYAKKVKDNISMSEKQILRKIIHAIVQSYGGSSP